MENTIENYTKQEECYINILNSKSKLLSDKCYMDIIGYGWALCKGNNSDLCKNCKYLENNNSVKYKYKV